MIKDAFTLEDTTAAADFGGGYPLGNGEIGAFILGGARTNEIRFTHNAFYSGRQPSDVLQLGAAEAFQRMRAAVRRGDLAAVNEEAKDFIGIKGDYGTNLPVGTLSLEYRPTDASDDARYELVRRTLDIRTGIAERTLRTAHSTLQEQCFISTPARAFLLQAQQQDRPFDLCITWHPGAADPVSDAGTSHTDHPATPAEPACEMTEQGLCFTVDAGEHKHCVTPCGAHLTGRLQVMETDGRIIPEEDTLTITGAHRITLCLPGERLPPSGRNHDLHQRQSHL